ncbi:cytoplasmic incompatibility factor CifA [Wolbachia endosymbiont of Phyllotreta cruciferae]|uniref:cytoplasmic incompatibility factor CifA n=1 Tax=Wolbachia endosymbiont of Phyllotreta cruciferae TaxID=2886377 RepID=UPI00209D091B|nr:cytoplasmic incompatibility factor CifA [Wolbachia endosymbiont of Phyllotreta cruciferae]
MPIETKRQAAVLKKLQDVIKYTDPEVAAGRKLAIKRWVETYIENIKSFEGDKLQFLYNIFQDKNCWSGTRLDNAVLGQRLTEEKIREIDNPLRRYDMACRYCVVDKIPSLFKEQFDSYKRSFSSNAVDGNGRPVKDDNKYILNSLLYGMKREDPVLSFWIDKESGELRQPGNAEEGFDSAIKLKWSEGAEYFSNQLEEKAKEKKLAEAIIALSRVQSVEKDAPILDFCIRNVDDKDTLLQELLRRDDGVYHFFSRLIRSCFFDTVHDLVQCWCYKEVSARGSHSEKIFSQDKYELLLYSLSNVMLKNPELSVEARSLIMEIWKCDRFTEYRKTSVNTSNYTVPIKSVLGGLIINWKRGDVCKPDEEKKIEKKEILDIISFARVSFPKKFELFKEIMIENLRLCGREGMEEDIDYGSFAKELFSELEKATLPPRDDGSGDYRRRSISTVEAEDSSLSIRHDGSGDAPKSILGTPGIRDFSPRSK